MAAALDVSAILTLSAEASELLCKGRSAHAAEKWGLAAEVGRALGAPDCLVVAHLQLREAESLLGAAHSETPERARAPRHRALVELMPPMMAVVERRRLAGTLLFGKCAPHEVEWWSRHLATADACDVSETALYAQFVGYEAYLRIARLGLHWPHLVGLNASWVPPPPIAQTQLIFSCATTALDLIGARRQDKDAAYEFEAALLSQVCDVLHRNFAHISREHRGALAAALDRLISSGVLKARGMDAALKSVRQESQRMLAAAEADNEACGLHSCAHCGARELHVAHFKRCTACKGPRFCGKECQLANWPSHKAACKAARKAAAADDA